MNLFEFTLLNPLKAIWQTDRLTSDSDEIKCEMTNDQMEEYEKQATTSLGNCRTIVQCQIK